MTPTVARADLRDLRTSLGRLDRFALAFCFTFAAGCSEDQAPTGAKGPESAEGDLAVEVRANARVKLEERPNDLLDVTFTLDRGFDLLEPGSTLAAQGRIERFPETGLRLYTVTFPTAPSPRADSPCGAKAPTLILSLTRRLENARVSGALTAYCDASPKRVLRVAGNLPIR